jgi:hypothetical protein
MIHAGAEFAKRIADRSKVVRTSCSNVTLPLSGGNGTPTWPEMKIQEPVGVSMRNASLKVGEIGLGSRFHHCIGFLCAIAETAVLGDAQINTIRPALGRDEALQLGPPHGLVATVDNCRVVGFLAFLTFAFNDRVDLRRAALPGEDDILNRLKLALGETASEFQGTPELL